MKNTISVNLNFRLSKPSKQLKKINKNSKVVVERYYVDNEIEKYVIKNNNRKIEEFTPNNFEKIYWANKYLKKAKDRRFKDYFWNGRKWEKLNN